MQYWVLPSAMCSPRVPPDFGTFRKYDLTFSRSWKCEKNDNSVEVFGTLGKCDLPFSESWKSVKKLIIQLRSLKVCEFCLVRLKSPNLQGPEWYPYFDSYYLGNFILWLIWVIKRQILVFAMWSEGCTCTVCTTCGELKMSNVSILSLNFGDRFFFFFKRSWKLVNLGLKHLYDTWCMSVSLCMKWHGAWLYGVHRTRRDSSMWLQD